MRTAPGIAHWIPLPYGRLKEFLRNPLDFQVWARERFGDVFRFRIGPMIVHFLYHPDHVRHVLQDNQKNYPRAWHYRVLRRLLGENLVVSEGAYWLRQRRLAQPAFHRQRFNGYAQIMADSAARMLARWETGLDVVTEMSRLALTIAGRTLFGRDTGAEADVVGRAFSVAARCLERRFNHPITSLPIWVPTPENRRMKQAIRTLNDIVFGVIHERRQEGTDRGDLLSMLMQARDDETGEAMTENQLRSEALTFLIAGHETTATALTWTCYLLASHKLVQRRVRDEIAGVFGTRRPTAEDLPQLTTTRMVIEESMRLYPPIWAVARQATQEDEIGGFRIPAGSTILLSQFVTHRHPVFWERPEVFDPDRFTPERVSRRMKYAYLPFLGGPHQCIGNEFAMLEMCLIVAMVVQTFEIDLLAGQSIEPKASLSLRPTGPVRVALKRRPLSLEGI